MSIRADQKRTFREAIRNLSGYYGVKDANSFMSILLASATDSKVTASSLGSAVDFAKEGTLDELADVLLALSGDGLYVHEMVKKIDEYCSGKADDPVAKGFITNPKDKEPLISVTTLDGNDSWKGEDYKRATSIKEILMTTSELETSSENMKSISAIEIHHPNLNFSNRDTAAAAIFLQSLPSIEMSKAVPYFDIKVITRGSPIEKDPSDAGSTKQVFSNGISIYKFLHGENISETGEDTMKTLISSTPIELTSKLPDVGGTSGDTSDTEEEKITVGGMELFTSPQTMVNGNLTYTDLDTTRTESVPSDQKILDKFRPFLTLTGFDVNVAPSVGPLSTESASMKIKLHDKTRLREIAALVVPGQLGTVELMIDYGWSHPQPDPAENPYGALINSMRRRSKWGIVNSSYTFTSSGEVDISLKLITKGAANAAFELISNTGGDRPDASLNKVIKEVRAKFRDLKGKGYTMNEEMGAPDVIGKTTSMKGLSSIEPDDWKKIEQFLKNMKSRSKGDSKQHWEGLATKITEAQTKQSSLLDALVDRFKDKMAKCAAVPPTKVRRLVKPAKSKSAASSNDIDSQISAMEAMLTPSGEKQKSDSIAQSDTSVLNEDGELIQGENDREAEKNTSSVDTSLPDVPLVTTREGGNDAISKEIEKQKAASESPTSSNAYTTVTVYPPFGELPEKQTSDPYLVASFESLNKSDLFNINQKSHVSFAKLLLHFVAEPLANTLKFDEVQLIFYPINEYAMWARKLNVGQYPVNKARFQEVFYDQLKKSSSMTIQKFINLIARNFFQFQGDDIYGLSSFYGKDEKGKMAIKKKYQKDEKSKIDFTESKQEVLAKCYPDSPIKRFKKPQIKMNIECVPHQTKEGETILRLHFFDQAVDSYSSYTQLWQATSASELGIVGKYASSVKKYQAAPPPPKKGNNSKEHKNWQELTATRQGRVVSYKKHFETAFKPDEDGNMTLGSISLKKMKIKIPKSGNPSETEEQIVYRIEGGPDQLRGILATNMPTLKYGTEFSGILNASLSTQSDPSMETINMKRQGVGNVPQGVVDDGLPLTIRPVTLSLDTFGCPFVYFGQQFFVDFQTNTTIDDVYTVTGISHQISQKEFKTNIKLVPLNKLGQYRSMTTSLATISAMSEEISGIVDKN